MIARLVCNYKYQPISETSHYNNIAWGKTAFTCKLLHEMEKPDTWKKVHYRSCRSDLRYSNCLVDRFCKLLSHEMNEGQFR